MLSINSQTTDTNYMQSISKLSTFETRFYSCCIIIAVMLFKIADTIIPLLPSNPIQNPLAFSYTTTDGTGTSVSITEE